MRSTYGKTYALIEFVRAENRKADADPKTTHRFRYSAPYNSVTYNILLIIVVVVVIMAFAGGYITCDFWMRRDGNDEP